MSGTLRESLLASSVNGGGVFLVEPGRVERLSKIDTTGIGIIPGGFLCARQVEGRAELRRLRDRQIHRICLVEKSLDLHDLLWQDDRLYVVATALNAVFEFDADFAETRHWILDGDVDSQHVNSICKHEGRLLVSRFGRFEQQRGYKGLTRGAGEVFDLETGEVVISGLSQPHSLKSVDGRLWLCDSETHVLRAYRNFIADAEVELEGYVRGLAFGASEIYVGLSRSRNEPDSALASASIVALDRVSLAPIARVELPTNEIYDLHVLEDTAKEDLRAAALADANAEFDTLAHERNLAAQGAYLDRVESAQLTLQLNAARNEVALSQMRNAELSAALEAARSELVAARFGAGETAAWVEMLEADNERLQQIIDSDERYIERQADFLRALEDFTSSIMASRSWRITRALRRIDAAPPATFGEPFVPADRTQRANRANVPILGLEFEQYDEPLVSIVVTSYGRFEETLACLKAIRVAGASVPYEVILIEDCSAQVEMGRFRSVPGLRYHENEQNLGFLRSANQAGRLARGHYVHFLNNDTQVQPGWLEALLRAFSVFHDCGLVGSKLVYPDGRLQEAGGIVWSDADACNFGRDDESGKAVYNVAHEVDYVSGASLLLPIELFRRLNGFDERYSPAYYEDTDLAFRVRERGRKVYVEPRSVVVHEEGLSHGTDVHLGAKAGQVRNREVFLSRWAETLQREQLLPGEHVFLAKDRAQLRKSVLVIDRHPPHTDRDAGSRAIWQLMRVMHLFGFNVKFWSQQAEYESEYGDLLQMHGIELLDSMAVAGGFDAWMAQHGVYLDYVLLSRPLVAAEYIDAVRRFSAAGVIFYGHDVHYLRIDRQFAVTSGHGLDAHARHLQSVEEDLWRRSDLILYPSDEETRHVQAWLDATGSPGRVATIPLFAYEDVPTLDSGEPLEERREVLFVGGFAHAPNADGVAWFVREVWPLVQARHPEYRLCLVGSDPTDEILALAAEDVVVTGSLTEPALIARYGLARVAIAPMRFGAGLKGKVLESMRFGVPCVTTSVGAQGLSEATFLRVADEAPAMAAHIVELIEDSEAWLRIARDAQAFVRERYSVAAVWNTLAEVMDPTPYADVAARRERIAMNVRHSATIAASKPDITTT